MCENYFLETETKYWFMQLAFAATMIRPGRLHDSLIARKLSASEFSHSLGHKQTLKNSVSTWMAPGPLSPSAQKVHP